MVRGGWCVRGEASCRGRWGGEEVQTANLWGLLDGLEKSGDMVGEKFVGGKRGAEVGECHMREFC